MLIGKSQQRLQHSFSISHTFPRNWKRLQTSKNARHFSVFHNPFAINNELVALKARCCFSMLYHSLLLVIGAEDAVNMNVRRL